MSILLTVFGVLASIFFAGLLVMLLVYLALSLYDFVSDVKFAMDLIETYPDVAREDLTYKNGKQLYTRVAFFIKNFQK